jgi:Protein of unknown function (DUF1059)
VTWVIHCDCGTPVKGETDDQLVKNVQEHAKNKHGVILTREQALGLAEREQQGSRPADSKVFQTHNPSHPARSSDHDRAAGIPFQRDRIHPTASRQNRSTVIRIHPIPERTNPSKRPPTPAQGREVPPKDPSSRLSARRVNGADQRCPGPPESRL